VNERRGKLQRKRALKQAVPSWEKGHGQAGAMQKAGRRKERERERRKEERGTLVGDEIKEGQEGRRFQGEEKRRAKQAAASGHVR
jgi:hypothetical protein